MCGFVFAVIRLRLSHIPVVSSMIPERSVARTENFPPRASFGALPAVKFSVSAIDFVND